MRIKYVINGFFILIIILALVTNPTKEAYMEFWKNKFGEEISLESEGRNFIQYLEVKNTENIPLKVEKVNFYIFSTYTSMVHIEHGVTYMGLFGNFIQISNGQFDYPWWLSIFTKH